MISLLFKIIFASRYFILICANEINETATQNYGIDQSNFIAPNSSQTLEQEEVEQLARIMFDEYWQLYLLNNPEAATALGDPRYDDRLSSHSLKFYEKEKVMLNEFLERANQMLPHAAEGSSTQSNIQLFIANLGRKLNELMSGSYLLRMSKMYTPEMSLIFLLKYVKLNESKQYWNLVSRYRAMVQQVDEDIELMREGIRTNFTLSAHSLPVRRNYSDKSIEDTSFYKPFLNISLEVSPDEVKEIQTNASDTILNYLIPAFEKLDNFLENEYRPHVRSGIGVSSLPNGEDYYKQMLSYHLTVDNASAEHIHSLGLSEVARISSEIDEVIQSLGFNLSFHEFNEYLRQDDSQHFSSEEEALETYQDVLENVITSKLPQFFKYLPRKKLEVCRVPKEFATGAQAFYMVPSADDSTPGTFFLDTTNLKSLGRYDLMTLSLHEGIPGHHFQFAYLMEQEDLPAFRKYDVVSSAFVEGWALYAEFLGYEMGLYEDLYLRFGHLANEMFRACRLVVDTGIHVLGWSRQEAIDYMSSHLPSSISMIEREVDRYISWPGQACSYKFGEIKIKEMRKRSANTLGDDFDIKEFHDVILRNPGPLAIVEKEVNRYIESVVEREVNRYIELVNNDNTSE